MPVTVRVDGWEKKQTAKDCHTLCRQDKTYEQDNYTMVMYKCQQAHIRVRGRLITRRYRQYAHTFPYLAENGPSPSVKSSFSALLPSKCVRVYIVCHIVIMD
jgi:hypothetical protein